MIVGIMGFARTGKNTVADFVRANAHTVGLSFVEVALADAVKRTVAQLFDFTEEQCWGSEKDKPDRRYPRPHKWVNELGWERCACCRVTLANEQSQCYLTPRYAQQMVGTEGGRACVADIWVRKLLKTAHELQRGGYSYKRTQGLVLAPMSPFDVVVPDVRFCNEVARIKEAGGQVFRVKHPERDSPPFMHASEVEQTLIPDEDLDGVIYNDGTLEDLERKVKETILTAKLRP